MRAAGLAAAAAFAAAGACSFEAPDFNQPVGCGCDAPPHTYVYCDYARCLLGACKLGYVDSNRDPDDGCEIDASETPGRFKLNNLVGSSSWTASGVASLGLIGSNVAVSIDDPGCIGSSEQPCSIRIEALQLLFDGFAATFDTTEQEASNVVVQTTAPLALADIGLGVSIDGSNFAVGALVEGAFTALSDLRGHVRVARATNDHGDLLLSIYGSLSGYIGNAGIFMELEVASPTRLYTSPHPDAGANGEAGALDAMPDGTSSEADARGDAAGDRSDAPDAAGDRSDAAPGAGQEAAGDAQSAEAADP